MYQPSRETAQPKVRLPRQDRPPELSRLEQALTLAIEQKGTEVEASWFDSALGKLFSLIVQIQPDKELPTWFLWLDDGQQAKLLWNYETSELAMVNDLLLMSDNSNREPAPTTEQGQINTSALASAPANFDPNPAPPPSMVPAPQLMSAHTPQPPATIPRTDFASTEAGQTATLLANAAASLTGRALNGLWASSPDTIEGNLEFTSMALLLRAINMASLNGKLEIVGSDSVGTAYFALGSLNHANTTANTGDTAIVEMVAWRKGTFKFVLDEISSITSISLSLDENIAEGSVLLDKKKHLERAGLNYESYLVKRQRQLTDGELKVFLIKGSDIDLDVQIEIYRKIGARCTLADLLRDRPMEGSLTTRVLYNFLTCGLIEIKPPAATVRGIFDFLGESKDAVNAIEKSLARSETGILTYEALLYFLRYEFYRYEAYSWPMSLALFDLSKRSRELAMGIDLISQEEAATAIKRVELIKRPMDMLGHFETLHYALLFPNTKASAAAYVANRVLQAMTAAPLSAGLDKRNLHVGFGIASIPADGEDLEALILAAKNALTKSKEGDFPIVIAHGPR